MGVKKFRIHKRQKQVITKEQEQEAFDSLYQYEKEQEDKAKEVISIVSKHVTQDYMEELKQYILDCDQTHSFSIEDKPCGSPQDEGGLLGNIYVNQYTNGGYTGDTYAGCIAIEFTKGKFLTFHYNM